MQTTCPHCSQGIEMDPPTLHSLQEEAHFDNTFSGVGASVPVLAAGPRHGSIVPLRPGAKPSCRQRASVVHMNRSLRDQGTLTLLTLGGVRFFMASQNAGNIAHNRTNIMGEILNKSYFTNLITSSAATPI